MFLLCVVCFIDVFFDLRQGRRDVRRWWCLLSAVYLMHMLLNMIVDRVTGRRGIGGGGASSLLLMFSLLWMLSYVDGREGRKGAASFLFLILCIRLFILSLICWRWAAVGWWWWCFRSVAVCLIFVVVYVCAHITLIINGEDPRFSSNRRRRNPLPPPARGSNRCLRRGVRRVLS